MQRLGGHERPIHDGARLLLDVSHALAAASDETEVLERAVHGAIPELGDWCSIHLLREESGPTLSAMAHSDPNAELLAERLRAIAPEPHLAPERIRRAMQASRAELLPDASVLAGEAPSAAGRAALHAIAPRAALLAPLMAGGRVLGVACWWSSRTGPWLGDNELMIAEDLAIRFGLALAGARSRSALHDTLAARDRLLRGLAHDLKGPVGAILLQTSALERLAPERLAAQLPDSAAVITRSATRIRQLADEAAELTGLAAGRVDLALSTADPVTIAEAAVAEAAPRLAKRGLTIRIEQLDDLVPVACDRERTVRALRHMIDAVSRESTRGGELVVELGRRNGQAELAVSSATVEPARARPVIAEARLDLGVALATEIAKAHGGSLETVHGANTGARITITLPLSH